MRMINYTESEFLSQAARDYFAAQDYESPEFQERYQALMYGEVAPSSEFEAELVRAQRITLAKFWKQPSPKVQ
jgi:hypothetical protein